ncbi:hypothetical protein ACFXDJ_20275 [Streptomyces sp. NPDC059443]|uniref:hypothetical protein n=1 Tax=unclassified Streptomyces TaxID=2593676 RepID=UPI00368FEBD3
MRSTRTAPAALLSAVVAALALTAGSAGEATASGQLLTPGTAGVQDEVPWTGPVPRVIAGAGDTEVPWT